MDDTDKSHQNLNYTRLAEPTHKENRKLLALWRGRQAEDGFVMGHDIPSRATASLLHGIMILEPLEGCKDYHIRLSGTSLRRRWAQESTGLRLSDVFGPDWFDTQLRLTNEVLHTGEPLILEVTEYKEEVRSPIRRETMLLRILSPDRKTFWILVAVFYKD